jgi:phosphoserine aminotransferase
MANLHRRPTLLLGAAIRRLRTERGMTLDQLASTIGIDRATLSKIETGRQSATVQRVEQIAASNRYIPEFLSLKLALDNSRLNQTLNTPSIATLFLLKEQIRWINSSGGLKWADAKTRASSKLLYDWADNSKVASAFVTNPGHRSQVVVTIDFDPTIDAAQLVNVLRENGIVDVDPYRKLGRNQLRVATFTATDQADIEALISSIDFVLERLAR